MVKTIARRLHELIRRITRVAALPKEKNCTRTGIILDGHIVHIRFELRNHRRSGF
jgi:hypothetical protein